MIRHCLNGSPWFFDSAADQSDELPGTAWNPPSKRGYAGDPPRRSELAPCQRGGHRRGLRCARVGTQRRDLCSRDITTETYAGSSSTILANIIWSGSMSCSARARSHARCSSVSSIASHARSRPDSDNSLSKNSLCVRPFPSRKGWAKLTKSYISASRTGRSASEIKRSCFVWAICAAIYATGPPNVSGRHEGLVFLLDPYSPQFAGPEVHILKQIPMQRFQVRQVVRSLDRAGVVA